MRAPCFDGSVDVDQARLHRVLGVATAVGRAGELEKRPQGERAGDCYVGQLLSLIGMIR
jgi:hypothetical protein